MGNGRFEGKVISIHAPTRGATSGIISQSGCRRFQSTLLQEERLSCLNPLFLLQIFQSTLLQEERLRDLPLLPCRDLFQSTLLQEERQIRNSRAGNIKVFQSTLLQEERRRKIRRKICTNNFNPRSYKRSDEGQRTPPQII